MGRGVAMGNLNAALALSKTLGETAEKHGTDALETKPQEELVKTLDDWEKGSATDPKGEGEGGQPMILASAPAGLALSSGKATTLQAGSNLDLVAMGQAQLSAGKRLLLMALESVSIFAHKLGMKLIAADGDMSIQAHNGKMESIAAKDLSLMSVDGMVMIDASKGIMLRSGGGYILIKDGKIDFVCPGEQTFKSASQTFAAGSSQDAATAALPKSDVKMDDFFRLVDPSGAPIKDRRYSIIKEDGSTLDGCTDGDGRTQMINSQMPEGWRLRVFPKDPQ
jgi:type VI secretion system secreted protein VgrG